MKLAKLALALLCVYALVACNSSTNNSKTSELPKNNGLSPGNWLGTFDIQGQKMPFSIRVENENKLFLVNGEEEIAINNIQYQNDSAIIPMHIFDATIFLDLKQLSGWWQKNYYDDYKLNLKLEKETEREREREREGVGEGESTSKSGTLQQNMTGKWQVYFSSELNSPAIGEFHQNGNSLSGTFLTATGDYRYLTGKRLDKDSFYLSTFDGEHAFLFYGKQVNETLKGTFLSGPRWSETFVGTKNENPVIASSDTLTQIVNENRRFSFKAVDLKGDSISNTDQAFENKPMLIQIMGTWCPNCMDETAYLAKWAKKEKPENLEIVSLAFERKNDFEYAKQRLEILKEHYEIPYQLAFAGQSNKEDAALKLPDLNRVVAYPTLIFIDQNHKVQHIHTGFSGPGTGAYFEEWKANFNSEIEKLTAHSDK
ncbi:MAG: TlpA family protein disulfide reductase [Bacteroidetes bacterium]|nr:TlpA family protein disulfide reductase [Bacteroidota bacterium]